MHKRVKSILALSALTGATLLLTGFTWGFGRDKCSSALDLAQKLPAVTDDLQRSRTEAEILSLCAEGAAATFVQGTQAERAGNLDGAIAAYRRALQQEPALTAANGSLGVLYQQKGLTDDAAVELTKALTTLRIPAYHKALAKVMTERRFYALALYHYGETLRQAPDDADAIAGQAEVYAAQGQSDRAMDEYRRALLLAPTHEQASLDLSRLYLQQDQPDKALDTLKKAVTANSRSTALHLALGDLYDKRGDRQQAEYEWLLGGKKSTAAGTLSAQPSGIVRGDQLAAQGEIERAADAYQSVLTEQPDAVVPFERLGALYFKAGRDGDAITAYREASYRNSLNADVYYNLGRLYEKRNQLDEAIVSYKRAIERKPDHADARLKMADLRLSRGNTPEAVEQYVEFLKLKPESADIHLKLAGIFLKNKQPSYAEDSYKAVLKLAPDNLEANRDLASIYRSKGENDKAIALYKKALQLQKDDAETRNALVALYVKEKQYDDLTVLLKQAVDIAPDDPNNHYKLGLIYDFNKDYENAISSYKSCIALKPDHARALNALGRVYMKSGRLSEAREALEAAKKADPNLVEASVLLNNIQDDFNPEPRKLTKSKGKSSKKSTARKTAKPKSKAAAKAASKTKKKKQ